MRGRFRGWVPAALAVLPLFVPGVARGQTPDPNDYRLITRVPRAVFDAWLKEEVQASKGTFDSDRYHFVIGFSTGHYGSDPVHAIAMRRLAFSLLNNTFAAGDRVTPVGWELKLWHRGKTSSLTADPQTRAMFVDEVPYAPATGSKGGHDTERAMHDVLTRVVPSGQAASTVILLLTNTNQSQGPTGERVQLFGSNNPKLRQALSRWRYRSPVRRSFRTESRRGPMTIDVTGLFPRELVSLPGVATGPRYPTFPPETWQPAADRPDAADALPNATAAASGTAAAPATGGGTAPPAPPAAPDEPEKGLPWWLWPLLLLIVLAIVFLLLRNKKPAPAKKEEPRRGRPLPGSITLVLGAAPYESRLPLRGLTTASAWALVLDDKQEPALIAEEEKPEGTRLASARMDEKGRLEVKSEGDATFLELKGVNTAACNSRLLVVAPEERLACRLSSAHLKAPARMEWIYRKEGQG